MMMVYQLLHMPGANCLGSSFLYNQHSFNRR